MKAVFAVFLLLLVHEAFSETLLLTNASRNAAGFEFSFPTASNRTYTVNWSTLAPPGIWHTATNVYGNGGLAGVREPANTRPMKVYRVFAEAPLRHVTLGEIGPTTARLAVGLDRSRQLAIMYSTNADLAGATVVGTFLVSSMEDYTRAIDLIGLSPNTRYFYNVVLDRVPYYSEPYPNFQTARPQGTPGIVRLAFGSCMKGTAAGGYGTIPFKAPLVVDRIWRSIGSKLPDFFLHLGDTAYCDHANAQDLRSYRVVHRHALDERLTNMGAYAEFRRSVPFYTTWDDHELMNDWPWSPLVYAPWDASRLQPAKQSFREYHARGNPDPLVPGELYYTLQYGDVGVFMTDTRSFRSCQQGEDSLADIPSGTVTISFNGTLGTASGAGWNGGLGFTSGLVGRTIRLANGQTRHIWQRYSPTQISVSSPVPAGTQTFTVLGKTILGSTQKQHLKTWLLQNKDALRVKFIGTATPIHGLSEHITAKDSWGAGYEAELNDILDFTISNSIRNVIFLSGDQHWSGSFNRRRDNVNFFEFMSSPISSFGYPKYRGTNEALLSRVNWMFDAGDNSTNGENFGVVTVRTEAGPITVSFELFDAQGGLINSTLLRETVSGFDVVP